MRHVLVVGGTGMLRRVSLELARQDCVVSVVAKRQQRLNELAKDAAEGRIHPICVDYHDTDSFTQKVQSAINKNGPVDLAVVWIHSSAPEAPFELARLLNSQEQACKYVHVLGSSAAHASAADIYRQARFRQLPYIQYHEVILGFVLAGSASRWLYNSEIANGVLDAVALEQKRYIVCTVEPWSMRP